MSSLICPVVVGREKELGGLAQVLRQALAGAGSVAFLLGEAGIGKTRVARETRLQAQALGMRVLEGRAVEGGTQVPFRPFAEAFQAAFRDHQGLPDEVVPFRGVLGKVVPQWTQHQPAAEANPVLVFEAVVRLLRVLGEPSGALLILEDLHWADAETLSAVEYVADQLSATRVACVLTGRTDEPLESVRTLTRVAARFPRSRFTLERLGTSQVEEMTQETVGDAPMSPELLSALAERSEGVPLIVEELLSAYSESARQSVEGVPLELHALPSSYAMVIEQRLALLDANERKVVTAAAAVGSDIRPEILSTITGLPRSGVIEGLRSCVRVNLLVEHVADGSPVLIFRHAMVGDAVLAQLLPDERRDLYSRAADAVQQLFPGLPEEWCNRVAQLRLKGGDPEAASGLLVEIGRRALKRGALLTAQQALERARQLVHGDRWKTTGVDRVLVRVLSLLGSTHRLGQLGDSVISFMEEMPDLLGTPENQGEVLLQIARGIASSRDWKAVRERMKPVVDLAEQSAVEDFRIRVRAFEARVALELRDLHLAESASTAVLMEALRLAVADAICEARQVKSGVALARHDLDHSVRLLHEAKLYAERRDLTFWRVEILLDLAAIDETRTASLENIVAARELVGMLEAPQAQARVDLQIARTRLARFELDLAEEALHRAMGMCRRYHLPLLREAFAVEAQVGALRGDVRAVRACAKEADALAATTRDLIGFHEARVILKLVRGDLDGVKDELARAADLVVNERLEQHRWLAGFRVLIRALEGDDRENFTLNIAGPLVRHAEAIGLGRDGKSDSANAIFEAADRQLEVFPWRHNIARRIVAEAALKDGWGQPATWLTEASRFFDSAGQMGLASACKGLLRRAGVAVPRKGRGRSLVPESLRLAGITSREMDVLELIGEGLSNKQIAQRLYLSVRTVESHVASAMRKLDLDSRPQLIARLVEERAAPK